ncbi:MAG: head GIN domain-containing protein [Cellulophaga sp.]
MKNDQKTSSKKSKGIMLKTFSLLMFILLSGKNTWAQSSVISVKSFKKVIVSPHISVTFKEGDKESVTIETSHVPNHKINIEVNNGTLWVYLDGAKTTTKTEKHYENGRERTHSIYKGTQVTAIITYKTLKELSLRGEENFVCESLLKTDKFRLKIYGESQVYLNNVDFKELHTTIYGESYLEIKEGSIESQKFTSYGESKINTLGVKNRRTKVTAYGEGSFRFTVSDHLKVTAYGEATVAYQGNPEVRKGLVIGEAIIRKIN